LSKTPKPARQPLQPLEVCDRANQRLNIDLIGPLKTTSSGDKYVMVMTDGFTKFCEVAAIPHKLATVVARTLFERWIIRYSAPESIVLDQGKEFCNKVMYAMCDLWGIKKKRTSPLHPQANTGAESFNRSFRKFFMTTLENTKTLEWEELLPYLMLMCNTHVHKSTQDSPFFLTFMHDPRMPFFDMDKPRVAYGADFASETFRMMQHVHQVVKVNLEDAQECSKRYYDKTAKERSFLPGDSHGILSKYATPRINPNFFSHWVPYTVVQMVGKVNAQVRNKETRKSSIIHLERIKELREDLEEKEETAGMQQGQQQDMRARPKTASHAKEDEGKQHEEVRVGRGPAGAKAAVSAQDRDIREQVEAEQGKKSRTKPKKQKQPEMQAGWLPHVDHAGKKGARTLSMVTNRLLG
jgi:transposase InsO family protein